MKQIEKYAREIQESVQNGASVSDIIDLLQCAINYNKLEEGCKALGKEQTYYCYDCGAEISKQQEEDGGLCFNCDLSREDGMFEDRERED